jgi:hypothetical protein
MQCGGRADIAGEMGGCIHATTPGPSGEFRFEHNFDRHMRAAKLVALGSDWDWRPPARPPSADAGLNRRQIRVSELASPGWRAPNRLAGARLAAVAVVGIVENRPLATNLKSLSVSPVGLNFSQLMAVEIASGALGYIAVDEQFSIAQRMESVPPPGRPASRSVLNVGRRSERGGGVGEYRYLAAGHDRSGRRGARDPSCRGGCAGSNASGCGFGTCSPSGSHIRVTTCYVHFGLDRASGPATTRVSGSRWSH